MAEANDVVAGWDVFVSYAREDGDTVARPLARLLDEAGLRVWFDDNPDQIDVSDRLAEKLNLGLARSRFGVAVLSEAYLAKKWTRAELDAFLMRERRESGAEVVIPVLHGIDEQVLYERYPLVADRIWLSTGDGLEQVAASVVRVVFSKGAGSPSQAVPTVRRRFLDLLEGSPDVGDVRAFLGHHPTIVTRALGVGGEPLVVWSPPLGDHEADVCVGQLMATAGRHAWNIVSLGPVDGPLIDPGGDALPAIEGRVADIKALRRWISANLSAARTSLPDVTAEFWGTVVAGRRAMTDEEKTRLAEYNDLLMGSRIRTYDWLVDHA